MARARSCPSGSLHDILCYVYWPNFLQYTHISVHYSMYAIYVHISHSSRSTSFISGRPYRFRPTLLCTPPHHSKSTSRRCGSTYYATPHSPPVPAFPRDSVLLSMLPPSIHSCAAQAVLRMSRCGVLQQRMSEGGLANAQVRPRSRLSHTIYARCLARKIRVDCLVENCAALLARSPRIMPTPALTTRCARSASNPPSST